MKVELTYQFKDKDLKNVLPFDWKWVGGGEKVKKFNLTAGDNLYVIPKSTLYLSYFSILKFYNPVKLLISLI